MAELTLDQILAAPDNDEALQRHMQAIGVLSPVAAPAPGPTVAAPLTRPSSVSPDMVPSGSTAKVAPMTPPARVLGADYHPFKPEYKVAPDAPDVTGAPGGVPAETGLGEKPMQLKPLNFKERQALPAGEPGTPEYFRSLIERQSDQAAHPWGKKVFDAQGNEVRGEENHPGVLGKIGHVLAKVGNIAGDIVAPGTMSLIPGTELNRRGALHEEEHGLETAEQREAARKMAEARIAHESTLERQAEERLNQGAQRVEQGDRRTTAIENKRPPAAQQVLDSMMGKVNPQTGHPYTADEAQVELDHEIALARHVATQDGKMTGAQADEKYRQITARGEHLAPEDANWKHAYEKWKALGPQATVAANQENKDRERLDRSYALQNGEMEKRIVPVEQLNQRLGRLRDTLKAGNPQADALVAPELLSIMAGGAGSGIRMSEAEIARIVGGRSHWQTLSAEMNKWATDPNSARSITPEQHQQIMDLVEAVGSKLEQKMLLAEEARTKLLDAESVSDHRRIVKDFERQADEIDNPNIREEEQPGGGGGADNKPKPKGGGGKPNAPAATAPKRLSVAEWKKQQEEQRRLQQQPVQ